MKDNKDCIKRKICYNY